MEPHGHLARIPVSKLLRELLTCFIKVSIKVPINMPITLLNTIKIDHIKKHTLLTNIKILLKQFYTIPIIPTEPKSLSFFSCPVPPHNPHLTFVPRPTFSPDLDRGPPPPLWKSRWPHSHSRHFFSLTFFLKEHFPSQGPREPHHVECSL